MSLNIDEVRRIALLARLRLSPEEEERFVSQLGRIVDYIDQLRDFSPAEQERRVSATRGEAEDSLGECMARDDFLANAPAEFDRFLLVPQIKSPDDE